VLHGYVQLQRERRAVALLAEAQKAFRKRYARRMHELRQRAVTVLQCAWRSAAARMERERRLEAKYRDKRQAARVFLRLWREAKSWQSKMAWVHEQEALFQEERQWRIQAATVLQAWYRLLALGWAARVELQRRRERDRASRKVQMAYRAFVARCLLQRAKTRKIKRIFRWKVFFDGILRHENARFAKTIQVWWRYVLMRAAQRRAALKIQRCYRGSQGRQDFFRQMLFYRHNMARRIQRAGRAHVARRLRAIILRKLNGNARAIQQCYVKHREWLLFKRAAREMYRLRSEARRIEKEVLQQHRAMNLMKKVFAVGHERACRRVQRVYRAHLKRKADEAERIVARELAFRHKKRLQDRRAAAEKHKAEQGKQKATKVTSSSASTLKQLGLAKTGQERMLELKTSRVRKEMNAPIIKDSVARRVLKTFFHYRSAEERREAEEVLTQSVMSRQTRSTVQQGIVSMAITVGQGETSEFLKAQKQRRGRGSGTPFYDVVDVDLSGKAKRNVYLWVMKGDGRWVWSSMTIQRAPPNHVNESANKSRVYGLREAGFVVCGHSALDFEIHGFAPAAVGEAAPALDQILVVQKKEISNMKAKGYVKVEPSLEVFGGSSKAFLMAHVKKPANKAVKHRVAFKLLRENDWFDSVLERAIEGYALTVQEILDLKRIFDGLDTSREGAIDIMEVFVYFGETPSRLGEWFMDTVETESKERLQFSAFVMLLYALGLMSKDEVLRWSFFMMDEEQAGFLERDQYNRAVGRLMEYEPNPVSMSKVRRLFDRYAREDRLKDEKGLPIAETRLILCFDDFVELDKSYKPLVWPILRLQDKVRSQIHGHAYWIQKLNDFTRMRKQLGVARK